MGKETQEQYSGLPEKHINNLITVTIFTHAWTECDTTSLIHQKGKLIFIPDVMYNRHAWDFQRRYFFKKFVKF